MSADILIRPFQPSDRQPLLKIAADTAFFGEPAENFMEDRRIFLDAFYSYYTDYEPEHAWVASTGNELVGFLVGCFDTHQQQKALEELESRAFRNLLSGEYRIGKKFVRYVFRYFISKSKLPKLDIDLSEFPAHFHINLVKDWRGKGIGRKLIEAYLAQLRQASIRGVHLQTTSYNKIALKLYEKMGFRLISSYPSFLWQGFVNEPIYEMIYGLSLDQ